MRLERLAALTASAAVLLLAAVGCTSAPRAAVENGACASPGVSADEVELGLLLSDTGAGSSALSSARAGVDARIGLANAAGGVHGRRVVYRLADDEGSPTENAAVAQKLVGQDSVFGLVAVTVALGGSLDALDAQGVPVVGLAVSSWKKYSNLFAYAYETSPETVARYIKEGGGTEVGFLATGSAESVLQITEQYRAAFERIGLTTTDTISYARGTDSPVQVAQRLAASGADALIGFTSAEDFADIAQAARQANLGLAVSVSLSGYDRSLLPTHGRALAGVSIPVYFRPFEAGGPSLDRYRDAMSRYSPQAQQAEQEYAMYGYLFADMFLRGLELAGDCPTRPGFVAGLRGQSAYDGGGLLAPVDLGHNAQQPLSCYAFVQVNEAGSGFRVTRERQCAEL